MTGAQEYGKALFLITEEDGVSDKILSDIKMAQRPDYTGNPRPAAAVP